MQMSTGEFDGGSDLHHARLDFLTAVDNVTHGAVRESLHKKCGLLVPSTNISTYELANILTHKKQALASGTWSPDYERLREKIEQATSGVAGPQKGDIKNVALTTGIWDIDYDLLLARILEWQHQYHLMDEWITTVAIYTLLEDGPGWRLPPYKPRHYMGSGTLTYSFDLARETEDQIIQRVVGLLTSRLKDDIAVVRDAAVRQGARQTPTKRKRNGEGNLIQDEFTHYEWLARHVVLSQSYARIAIQHSDRKTESAVKKAVQRTANHIQLSLPRKKN